jgi:hypothetical protein
MSLAVEWGTGQVLWSILWFFLFFIWIMLLFHVFGDIFTDKEMSGVAKVIWSLFVIIVPYLGVFIYIIARGHKMQENALARAQEMDAAQREYIKSAAGGTSTADELAKLSDLKANGTISQEEFDDAKRKLLS